MSSRKVLGLLGVFMLGSSLFGGCSCSELGCSGNYFSEYLDTVDVNRAKQDSSSPAIAAPKAALPQAGKSAVKTSPLSRPGLGD